MKYFVLYGEYDYELTIDVFANDEQALKRVCELDLPYVRVIKGVDLEVKRIYAFVEEGSL